MRERQREAALKAMIQWLSAPEELGKSPSKIECTKEFELHGMSYYVFKFKKGIFGDWMLGVCGGYEGDSIEHSGHVFSEMKTYDDNTALSDAEQIVENIRAYWMEQAEMQKVQENFKRNLKYISSTVLDAEKIKKQFVKTESRFFLTVGQVDCPTGKLITADPLAYLGTGKFSPIMEKTVEPGSYDVQVSIYRDSYVGIRMCTARLKLKNTEAVKYELAMPTEDSASAKSKDGPLAGFAVDAGMMCFCDAMVAEEYRQFILRFHEDNPDANHYDDYFAELFAESFKRLPAYQREGGDFIQWEIPETKNRIVMIASGFGDGYYQCYWGYDHEGQLCELTVPMVDPDLFEE